MFRRAFKQATLNVAERIGLIRLLQYPGSGTGNTLCILAYHRVDDPNSSASRRLYDLISATPEQFDAQMCLVASNFHPVSAEEVLEAADGGRRLPRHAVLVTVDDAYIDFKDHIFPIAHRYGIRPVLFVPTAYVNGGSFWWDRLFRAIKTTTAQEIDSPLGKLNLRGELEREHAFDILADYVRMQPFEVAKQEIDTFCESIAPEPEPNERVTLDWEELRELSRSGVTVASHTHTHPILSHLSFDRALQEIRGSQEIITREIGKALPIFAFPDGRAHAVSDMLTTVLQKAGFKIALTMNERHARLDRDPLLCLPRVIISRRRSLAQFHLQLTPLYHAGRQ